MPVLVVADIHGNLAALEAVVQDAGRVDAVWSLGDMVGYGPQPDEVIARLRALGAQCVAGNHEWAVLGKLDLDTFNPAAAAAAEWTARVIAAETRRYLAGLPTTWRGDGVTAVHGSPRDPIWEYVLSESIARANFAHFDTPLCLYGHTHIPAAYAEGAGGGHPRPGGYVQGGSSLSLQPGERYLLNPGSVGQPRDGDPRASYLLLDPTARSATWRRVEYDIERTQLLMQRAGLPAVLWQRLTWGR
jgi:diadenosine tetraphosphatase ApaH/serine/threonine PP2A family protein phosphatase